MDVIPLERSERAEKEARPTGRGVIDYYRSVHVTNRTSLGPEFCEALDLDQDLHYVVRYIDPENLLSV